MSRIDALNDELTKIRSSIDTITAAASAEARDLTEQEQADADALFTRAETIKPELDKLAALAASQNRAAEVLNRVAKPAVKAAENMTAGEFLVSALKAQAGVISMDEHLGRTAHVRAQQGTSDNAGILPAPIVGQLIEMYDASRPVWNSFTAQQMPSEGATFTRPEITQHVATGDQASQFATVSSQKMTITGNTVTKFTEAGYLDLSQQDIDWTSPSALNLVVQDFVKVFSNRLEARAAAYLVATASASSAWTATNVGTVVSSIATATTALYTASKNMPDTLWLSLDEVMSISATLTTDSNKSALTVVKEMLASVGVNLNIVTGPQLAADTRILGVSGLVESYLQTNGLVQIAQPDILGQRLAYSGYGALFGKSAGLVKLV